MGSVYLAERVDGAYRKQVAIKLVRPGANSGEILERFRRERQILASLDHPNIARLIDGGSTEEGLPYFVMEYVEGLPIHRWADEHKHNVTQRLELFRSVCDAVRYAHQHLVVHRDLKPGNILVTNDGTVKLLDFGIAKVVEPEQAGGLPETATMAMPMTPEYASPEQIKGEAITTLTDVYSLGVVLYELLTGHRPYHLMRAALHEIARVILDQEPARPSDVVTTAESVPESITPETASEVREGDAQRLRKRLQGDLDCILLTALRKEPARRYSSVESFSDDLRRHLESRPVSAREDSVWYRVSRFVHRHSLAVAAGVLIAVSLAASLVTELWQLRTAIVAGQQKLTGRALMAPQLVSWLCYTAALFGAAVLATRARLRRIGGALAGGALFSAAWFAKLRLDYAIGWWHSRFADSPDPLSLFSAPVMFAVLAFGLAAFLLVTWRASRRFGWIGPAVCLVAMGAGGAFRDRLYWDQVMHMMTIDPGVKPLLGDMTLLGLAFVLSLALMRLIAGPAKGDVLSRAEIVRPDLNARS
jgi:serine/threonine protein kinase